MKHLIISILLLALFPAASPAQSKRRAVETLSLAISTHIVSHMEGEPIPIQLVFKNIGKKRTGFVLPDNAEDPPGFIWARVRDTQGAILTNNDTLEDGWWTTWTAWSGFYKENKKDRISLKPDEEYTRSVDLKRLLAGCRCPKLPHGLLEAGTYRIQFALGDIVSNEIEIRIEK